MPGAGQITGRVLRLDPASASRSRPRSRSGARGSQPRRTPATRASCSPSCRRAATTTPSPCSTASTRAPLLAMGLISATQGPSRPSRRCWTSRPEPGPRARLHPRRRRGPRARATSDGSGCIIAGSRPSSGPRARRRRSARPARRTDPGRRGLRRRRRGAGRSRRSSPRPRGRIAAVSLGPRRDLARRVRVFATAARRRRAADGREGRRASLDELLRDREPGELLIVMQTPPDVRAPQLLPIGPWACSARPAS